MQVVSAPPVLAATTSLARDLAALIAHVHKNCNADLFATVGTLEITLTQLKLLHRLDDRDEELSLREAAEAAHVSLPAASRLVDELVRRDFVERREDPQDRRVKRVRISATGRAMIARVNAARVAGLEQFVATLEEGERESLAAALAVLMRRPEVAACRIEETAS